MRRKRHVRKKVIGTSERPRLSVFRSKKHIYCQVIDDVHGKTLVAMSTLSKDIRAALGEASTGNARAAAEVGKVLAERAREAGIEKVAFDRNGYKFHGRVKQLADAAREGGLKF